MSQTCDRARDVFLGQQGPPFQESGPDLTVVGLGGSAGSIPALRAVPTDTRSAYVVILRLSPVREGHLAQVTEPTAVERGHVYVISPDKLMEMQDGILRLCEFETGSRGLRSIKEKGGLTLPSPRWMPRSVPCPAAARLRLHLVSAVGGMAAHSVCPTVPFVEPSSSARLLVGHAAPGAGDHTVSKKWMEVMT